MSRWIGILLLLSPFAFSQTNVPGGPLWDQPLVTTPILDLGNGLTTGPTITYSGSVSTTTPLDISTLQPRIWMPEEEPIESAPWPGAYTYDLGIARLDSVGSFSPAAISLGKLALALHGSRPQIAHKSFTNDDIERITNTQDGRTGILEARTERGPIMPKQGDLFEPPSGIANMPFQAEDPVFADGSARTRSDMRDQNADTRPSLDGSGTPHRENRMLPAGEPTQE